MLKLVIPEQAVAAASIPVRWCVDDATLWDLKERGVKHPRLLIVVLSRGRMERRVVPLDAMMEYVTFSRPGENKILATIVWDHQDDVKELKRLLLAKEYGYYSRDVLNDDGDNFKLPGSIRSKEFALVSVMVPEQLFAKEAPAWEKKWINYWFESDTRDQCHFRKRRILAYSIQPLAVFIWLLCKMIVALTGLPMYLLRGIRGSGKKFVEHFGHPFLKDWDDIGTYWKEGFTDDNSIFLKKKDGLAQSWLVKAVRPLSLLRGFTAALLVGLLMSLNFFSFTLIAVVALIIGAAIAIELLLSAGDYLFLKQLKKALEEERERAKKAAFERQYEDFEVLVCNGDLKPMITALPTKHRTVHLRFQELKTKVCKPFAR